MHRLYLLLKDALPEKEESYLLNEIIKILEKLNTEKFKEAMKILYGNNFDFKKNPGKIALLFVEGIKRVDLFSYVYFLKGISK